MLARLLGLNVRALRIFGSTALCLAWVAAGRASAFQHAQSALPWQSPSSAPAPPQGAPGLAAPGGSALPGGEASLLGTPLGTQPLPRVLELAASKVADCTALRHAGAAPSPPGAGPVQG